MKPDLWFFLCHFKGDPVMPGCLGLDALWQLLGFFLGWLGAPGKGRALGLGELKFSGQVLPTVKNVVYGIDIKRVMRSKLVLGIADGWLSADGNVIYRASDLKVGLFSRTRRCSRAALEPGGGPCGIASAGQSVAQSATNRGETLRHTTMRRVVVTGMGIVSSIGNNTQEVLASLREAKSGISRADEYAELGFRCQVHGAPTLNPAEVDRSPRHALPRRRRGLESRRHGAGDPRRRPRGEGHLQRAHRHHHGLRRTVDARHRRGRRHHPRTRDPSASGRSRCRRRCRRPPRRRSPPGSRSRA